MSDTPNKKYVQGLPLSESMNNPMFVVWLEFIPELKTAFVLGQIKGINLNFPVSITVTKSMPEELVKKSWLKRFRT
jgi:hypothetical protein